MIEGGLTVDRDRTSFFLEKKEPAILSEFIPLNLVSFPIFFHLMIFIELSSHREERQENPPIYPTHNFYIQKNSFEQKTKKEVSNWIKILENLNVISINQFSFFRTSCISALPNHANDEATSHYHVTCHPWVMATVRFGNRRTSYSYRPVQRWTQRWKQRLLFSRSLRWSITFNGFWVWWRHTTTSGWNHWEAITILDQSSSWSR